MKRHEYKLYEYTCYICGKLRTVRSSPRKGMDIVCEYCTLALSSKPRKYDSDGKKVTLAEFKEELTGRPADTESTYESM